MSDVFESHCSNNSWFGVGASYSGIYGENTTDNIPPSSDVYYILNFNNILTSYGTITYTRDFELLIQMFLTSSVVTLFVLMVVNNWYIIMVCSARTTNKESEVV